MAVCGACFRHCDIPEGKKGFCGIRSARGGAVVPDHYGLVSGLALDPIEKKPLARFHPGSRILSLGFFGCSMACPFCQNHEIAKPGPGTDLEGQGRVMTPEEVCSLAVSLTDRGNIGAAYTYNEPLTSYEFVRDCAERVRAAGLYNVLVTNGQASEEVLGEVLPWMDAMNIDLKSFREETYRKVLGGSLDAAKRFIGTAAGACHVEVTTLIVPGMNDTEEEMEELAAWLSSLDGGRGEIPLHVSRFFPRYRMADRAPTPVGDVYRLAETARRHLRFVYTGNC